MEPKFQSSFIPKGPLVTAGTATRISVSSGRSIIGTVAVFVFTLSVIASVGVFAYEKYLLSRIGTMGGDLLEAKTTLEPDVIEKISHLDERIVSTKQILDNHVILSNLFSYLEDWTLKNVRFGEFHFRSTADGYVLEMRGQARGYSAVALQSEIFNKTPNFKAPVFSDLDLDDKGNVTFSFKAFVNPSVLSYKSDVTTGGESSVPASEQLPVVAPVSPVSTSTSTTTLPKAPK